MQLLSIAAEQRITEEGLNDIILATTQYINELLELSPDSKRFKIKVLDYETFETLYLSIHEDLPADKIPLYNIAGAINLKDFDVPGYIVFSLPKQFVGDQDDSYTLKEFLVNAAHERSDRYLVKKTIIAKVYEKAREDYHQKYTLDKEKNVSAFLLYTLNKDLISIQETISHAIMHLVEEFIDTNYKICNQIHLPLIDRPFEVEEINITEKFKQNQLEKAQVTKAGSEIAYKRLKAGLNVLHRITQNFKDLCTDFLEIYPEVKSTSDPADYDINYGIETTIQLVLQKYGLMDLMALFNQEFTKLQS